MIPGEVNVHLVAVERRQKMARTVIIARKRLGLLTMLRLIKRLGLLTTHSVKGKPLEDTRSL